MAHIALSFAEQPATLLVATLLFGLTIGSIFMLQSLLVVELFGVASFGTVFGLLNFVSSIGGGLGPLAVGIVAARFGGYPVALWMLAVAAALGAVVVLRIPVGEERAKSGDGVDLSVP